MSWKYGVAARYTNVLVQASTDKAYEFRRLFPDAPDVWVPKSQIPLMAPTGNNTYEVWITVWFCGKADISIAGCTQRKVSELNLKAYTNIATAKSESKDYYSEHISDEDREAMEKELDFSDDPSGKYFGDHLTYNRFGED